jgi:hypothetical protein
LEEKKLRPRPAFSLIQVRQSNHLQRNLWIWTVSRPRKNVPIPIVAPVPDPAPGSDRLVLGLVSVPAAATKLVPVPV